MGDLPKGRPDRFVGFPDEVRFYDPDTGEEVQIADSQAAIDAVRASDWNPERLEDPNLDEDGYPIYADHRAAGGSDKPCRTCAHYGDSTSFCEMFGQPTKPTETCNEWSAEK